jgi:hypothetical protein
LQPGAVADVFPRSTKQHLKILFGNASLAIAGRPPPTTSNGVNGVHSVLACVSGLLGNLKRKLVWVNYEPQLHRGVDFASQKNMKGKAKKCFGSVRMDINGMQNLRM